jgi:hypothetical protein
MCRAVPRDHRAYAGIMPVPFPSTTFPGHFFTHLTINKIGWAADIMVKQIKIKYSETCIRRNLNKAEICSMWTNSIVPARRIFILYNAEICPMWNIFSVPCGSALYKFHCILKGKCIPVTLRRGLCGCETSRFPHFLNSRLTDGGEVVSLAHQPPFTPRQIPGIEFCYLLETITLSHGAVGSIR